MGLKLAKGDHVIVDSGKNKGKKGKIVRFTKDKNRVYIEGVNLVKRFVRPTRDNPKGGQVEKEAPIHVSNVHLFSDKIGKGTRFKNKVLNDGTKVRVGVKCGTEFVKG